MRHCMLQLLHIFAWQWDWLSTIVCCSSYTFWLTDKFLLNIFVDNETLTEYHCILQLLNIFVDSKTLTEYHCMLQLLNIFVDNETLTEYHYILQLLNIFVDSETLTEYHCMLQLLNIFVDNETLTEYHCMLQLLNIFVDNETLTEYHCMLQLLNIFVDNETLTEYCCMLQLPIIEYLEETRPDPPVLPKDAGKRAKVTWVVGNICLHLILFWLVSSLYPPSCTGYMPYKVFLVLCKWTTTIVTRCFVLVALCGVFHALPIINCHHH